LARSGGEEEHPVAVKKNAISEGATEYCVIALWSPSCRIPGDVEVTRHSQAASILDEDCSPQTCASSPAELGGDPAGKGIASQAGAVASGEAAEPRSIAATTAAPETTVPAFSAEMPVEVGIACTPAAAAEAAFFGIELAKHV
jgi:hypothetical protein